MDPSARIALLRADSAALLAAQRADPHAGAWEGLGWTRTQLLAHVANVHGWVRAQLKLGPGERIRFSTVEPAPEGDELPGHFEAGAAELAELLAAMDVEATWPTWAGPQPGTFFPRRMAQETAVHRWDADGGTIDSALCVDGIDELLELFAPRLPVEGLGGADGTIHLHATDTDGEWLITFTPEGIRFEHGHAKGDVALRGTAEELLLWTWNRVPVDERFEVFGRADLLTAWREGVRF
ncbi:MAG: maleylpyruvate isomerase family mycothiol-dependent enzyme [Acidimicrobiales bacterium]